jgi:hypothetical protein
MPDVLLYLKGLSLISQWDFLETEGYGGLGFYHYSPPRDAVKSFCSNHSQ